jgi:hypothetical protein
MQSPPTQSSLGCCDSHPHRYSCHAPLFWDSQAHHQQSWCCSPYPPPHRTRHLTVPATYFYASNNFIKNDVTTYNCAQFRKPLLESMSYLSSICALFLQLQNSRVCRAVFSVLRLLQLQLSPFVIHHPRAGPPETDHFQQTIFPHIGGDNSSAICDVLLRVLHIVCVLGLVLFVLVRQY